MWCSRQKTLMPKICLHPKLSHQAFSMAKATRNCGSVVQCSRIFVPRRSRWRSIFILGMVSARIVWLHNVNQYRPESEYSFTSGERLSPLEERVLDSRAVVIYQPGALC
jgi:hypothetical protein